MHHWEITVEPEGRIVLPMAIGHAAHLEPGPVLIARVDGDRVILIARDAIKRRLHEMFAHVDGSMASELISERRQETALEDHKS